MSSLEDLVEPLKRTVAVPGTFADVFPDTTDDDLIGSLEDGFSEAQLDGYFVRPTSYDLADGQVTPDLSRPETALVVIYTATRIVQTQLLNARSAERYEAKGLVFESQRSSQLLVALLKDLQARKQALIDAKATGGAGASFTMADQYFARENGVLLGSHWEG